MIELFGLFIIMLLLIYILLSVFLFACDSSPDAQRLREVQDNAADKSLNSNAERVSIIDGLTVVEITANDRMKYNLESFTVHKGQLVKLTLVNIGKLSKLSMGHNLVFLQAGTDVNEFASAAASARDTDYIPTQFKSQIIASTKLLGPGERDTIEFYAPNEPGEYIYLCSFPAHMYAGMRGIMTVE